MIQSIDIVDIPSFVGGPHQIFGLKPINYFFGPNGAGKTTISRAIASGSSPNCTIKWVSDLPLDRFVYNKDFIDANFSQPEDLKGIFTLGEDEINLAAQIEEQRDECNQLREYIAKLTKNRDGDPEDEAFEGEVQKQEKLDAEFKDNCWAVKVKHEKQYRQVLKGSLKKEKFRDRVLAEIANNKCTSVDVKTLPSRVEVVFGPDQDTFQEIPRPSFKKLIDHEAATILSKKVVGKKDVDVAAVIEKLGNSDWVKQGLGYLDQSLGVCPFCQQRIAASFKQSIDAYFDQTFLADTKRIETLKTNYANDGEFVTQQLDAIERSAPKHLDVGAFGQARKVLDLLLKGNNGKLQKKQEESSRVIALDTIAEASVAIIALIDQANAAIKNHNKMIADRDLERKKIDAEVWRLLLNDGLLKLADGYDTKKAAIDKAKKGLTEQIALKKRSLEKAEEALNELEKKTTSVEPTVKEINKLLFAFGFRGFSLAMAANKSSYKLVRANGEPAKHTLSEGEKSFVTFLYFYHLLKGSKDGTNVSSSRIIVFDDPVSSLDSDVLHIVSSLIRGLFEGVCSGDGLIKQIFILTHNIAFHKEVSYFKKQQKGISPNQITYWKVYKRDEQSQVLFHRTNPIKSSYEMLWAEIANKKFNCHTIQNTLRRILEQSAKLLGGIELKKLEKLFIGAELTACRTLMAWVNEGSHFCHDDICVTVDDSTIDIYLNVFKLIFERCGWGTHYRFMMQMEEEVLDDEQNELVDGELIRNA